MEVSPKASYGYTGGRVILPALSKLVSIDAVHLNSRSSCLESEGKGAGPEGGLSREKACGQPYSAELGPWDPRGGKTQGRQSGEGGAFPPQHSAHLSSISDI